MKSYDIVILGSGLAGSVTGLLLSKLGYKVLLVEKDKHPRFALGESSVPGFSAKLRFLAKKYDIPEFLELSSYDRIMASERPFVCGPKELFHYFVHDPGQTTARLNGEYREISVQTPYVDTQFLRSALDERLVEYAQKYGTEYVDMTDLQDVDFSDDGVRARLEHKGEAPYEIQAKFFIDATGFRSLLSRKFDLRIPDAELDTPLRSRTIFSHFENITSLEEASGNDPEFAKRISVSRWRGTQHHCFDGGWYWVIPFDNGITSVGVSVDMDLFPMNDKPAEDEFWEITRRYPIVARMLEGKKTVLPYLKSGRLQFRTRKAAGDRWALITSAAFGIDAWFSVGMAMTLVGIDRLVEVVHNKMFAKNDFRRVHLEPYETALFREFHYISRFTHGMYKTFKHWDLFRWWVYVCFLGAESYIHSGGPARPNDPTALYFNVGNDEFIKRFMFAYEKVIEWSKQPKVTREQSEFLRSYVQNDMAAYNFRDFGNPKCEGVHYRIQSLHDAMVGFE